MLFAVSFPLGYYRFRDVAAGQSYVLTAYHKRYIFYDNPRVLYVTGDVANIDVAGARSH